jgi:hypothetical protein
MASILNAVFGIAVAVVIFFTVILGVKAIFPEPQYPDMRDYCGADFYAKVQPIPINGTYEMQQCEKDFNAAQQKSEDARRNYGRIPFYISIIIGAILLGATYFIWNSTNIASGLACAGIALVIYGLARGWDSTGDLAKFGMMVLIAVVVLLLATKVRKKVSGSNGKRQARHKR